MNLGERVRVYPVNHPEQAAIGLVLVKSANGFSIMVAFGEEYVPFINASTGMAIHPEHGKVAVLSLENGTYNEVFGDRQFIVESA